MTVEVHRCAENHCLLHHQYSGLGVLDVPLAGDPLLFIWRADRANRYFGQKDARYHTVEHQDDKLNHDSHMQHVTTCQF